MGQRESVGYTSVIAALQSSPIQRSGPRLKRTRIALDEARSLAKGWTWRMRRSTLSRSELASWQTLSEVSVGIRQRPELGEQNENRIANMQRCADSIDGWLLRPNAVFGMRRAIGEPTKERGFRSGPSIVNGALEEDTGGGICQVSTVLFNVALLGGLEILEKHNHSTDIWGEKRLIELGRDAAFAYAVKDLKFRNQFPFAIAVQLEVAPDNSALIGRAVSPAAPTGRVDVTTEILQEITPPTTNRAGLAPVSGWRVHTRRTLATEAGSSITFDHTDQYQPTHVER